MVFRVAEGKKIKAHADCGKVPFFFLMCLSCCLKVCLTQVQDAYTLRCVPQIHGVCRDTLRFVHSLLTVEINSATDNPMVFSEVKKKKKHD
jgi:hypothetical protein